VRVVLSIEGLISRLADCVGGSRVEPPGLAMRERRGLLDPHLRAHERPQRLQAADRKVL
jgi:hypothetical protein